METHEYATMQRVEESHWWYRGTHDLVLRWVKRRAARGSLNILDAGCGTGRLGQLLQEFGTVQGWDIHPLAVESALSRGLHRVRLGDLAKNDLGREEFDVITLIDVLSHHAIPEEAIVLEKVHQALRSGGTLIVQVAAFGCLRGNHDRAVHTRRRYRCAEVRALLESSGFMVRFASYRLAPLFAPLLIWRRLMRNRLECESDTKLALPSWLNRGLEGYLRMENALLCCGIRLPAGTSVFVVAER